MTSKIKFLDLFAGAGGLSEGFIRAGFEPVAHVESDISACFTLRTRMAYHWLNSHNREEVYSQYLKGKLSRPELYASVPKKHIASVLNMEIGEENLDTIFKYVDTVLGKSKLDLIIGGPPCQAYSVVGRSRDKNGMKGDKRNYLYLYYSKFLKRYKPKYFVFENVTGLLSAKDEDGVLYFDKMKDVFRKDGYELEYQTLSTDAYGVLQKRKRIIIVGKRCKRSTGFYPEPAKWNPGVTVSEVFKDLPSIQSGGGAVRNIRLKKYKGSWLYEAGIRNDDFPLTWHQSRRNNEQDLEIYKIAVELWNDNQQRLDYNSLPSRLKTHNNRKSFLDRFKVVASDLSAAHTVVAHIAKDGHYYIHPDIKQNRSITPREAARLQTFPDDYYFEGASDTPSRTAAFKQIGNAVPVFLSQKIAEKLKEQMI